MAFRAHRLGRLADAQVAGASGVLARIRPDGATVDLEPGETGVVAPAVVTVRDVHGAVLSTEALVATNRWNARILDLDAPGARLGEVPDAGAFRARERDAGVDHTLATLEFPSALRPAGSDRYGVLARSSVRFAPGVYRLEVLSDDGVRVKIDGATVIERWDIHGAERDTHAFRVDGERLLQLEVEYFQNRGGARLSVRLAPDAGKHAP